MKNIYYNLVKKRNKQISFVILIYFIASFVIIRSLVYAWTYNLIPELSLNVRGTEIHHFNFGFLILVCVGYFLLVNHNYDNRLKLAKIYGIGLALAFDEFGMWLHLQDNYWVRQSYDGIIIITVVLLNAVYLNSVWQRIFEKNLNWFKAIRQKLLNH